MPWHWEPMKDATSCEKLRGGANNLRSGDIRMGKPIWSHFHILATEYIGCKREPPELKHLSRARKSNQTKSINYYRPIRSVCILYTLLLRKEVIQPHLPIRLPCYDFTPVAYPTFGSALLAVRLLTSGVTNSHGVTGGVYKARERIHRGMLIRDY